MSVMKRIAADPTLRRRILPAEPDPVAALVVAELQPAVELEASIDPNGPKPGSRGWYRVEDMFYRIGRGPFPAFGEGEAVPMELEAPAVAGIQLLLF